MDLSGKRLGHIRVDRILGQGGMGDVYEGFDEKLMRRVALKALHRDQRLDDEARARLIREARTLSQLDHPNICRIHDYIEGAEADVLVLELIEGRTLQAAIEEGLSRAEKLRISQAVAEVLVVAHRFGIVHRDLKPENIMMTKAGVVKVLDFGLARWIERQQSSGRLKAVKGPTRRIGPNMPVAEERQEEKWYAFDVDRTQVLAGGARGGNGRDLDDTDRAGYTAAGVTVGTPMFMSPEQARGETLTPASDMYSFGLLLQTLFTSEEPYPAESTGREVMLMAARGESLPVKGVNRDIAVLIARLKALAPTDRPTAVEAAARLRLISEKPKRMAQYAAVALLIAAVVGGTWKYIVDVRRERAAAVTAQDEAVRRRAQAEDLINFMVGDLRTKLVSVGRLEILDDVAQRALAYEASLNADTMSAEEAARNVKALQQLGDVRITQGRLADARQIFQRAQKLADDAVVRFPNDPQVRLAAATSRFWIGNAERVAGNLPAALAGMKEYRQRTESLAQQYPGNESYQLERAYGHSAVGTILEQQGDLNGAVNEYSATIAIKGACAAAKPTDAERQADLALTLNKIGFVLQSLGRYSEARQYFEREFAIYEALARKDPMDTHYQERVGNSHGYLTNLLLALGDISGATTHAQKAIEVFRALAAQDPANTDWQRQLAMSMRQEALLRVYGGNSRAAIEESREAEGVMQKLLLKEKRASWSRDLASVYVVYVRALLASGDAAAARAKAQAATAMLGEAIERKVASPQFLAEADNLLGMAEEALGNRAAAQAAWTSARNLLESSAQTSSDPKLLAIYTYAILRLGDIDRGRALLARTRAAGYYAPDIDNLCAKQGC